MGAPQGKGTGRGTLYTEDQRHRRDTTRWTLVQGILAPCSFSSSWSALAWSSDTWSAGRLCAATWSVVIKTLVLYTIMITGAIWEKVVFGKYLFAPPSSGKTCSPCWCWRCTRPTWQRCFTGALGAKLQMLLALAAYVTYVINAAQFLSGSFARPGFRETPDRHATFTMEAARS
jgi:3-vinyl bacteriochlorophyllide hydratase